MGCVSSTPADGETPRQAVPTFDALPGSKDKPTKNFARPKWKSPAPMTESELKKKREEFWDTQPYYGGDRVIWDALKAACEADVETCRLLIESAGIIVAAPDMTVCYDERGAKYELPKFVLSAPVNITKDE
ncbi:Ubiquitin domain-containing protein 2 [Tetrabaena socialis]|uniref:Ubiquitin domain-containing protein 2 n=1 Tax=Tetrabaena socialis TaxID=47790 RepID=A0A2J8ADN7_9CHLO|nr:Ubiquitin domain-containing protein 2 [Tetrabaena socialis]|eukprot:PNH10622.1 Ubiquitin domain-containing protein 2 [Tetrabaena socialis]